MKNVIERRRWIHRAEGLIHVPTQKLWDVGKHRARDHVQLQIARKKHDRCAETVGTDLAHQERSDRNRLGVRIRQVRTEADDSLLIRELQTPHARAPYGAS